MKEIYTHGGKAYIILRRIPIDRFNISENLLNMDKVKIFRDWCGADHVLRDNTHFMFCESIEDVEWEELDS
jgi:hypothetical protein